jgi:hypothetical protein
MQRNSILYAVALGAVSLAAYLHSFHARLGELERTPVADPARVEEQVSALKSRLAAVRAELAAEVERARKELACELEAGHAQIGELEAVLATADVAIRQNDQRLATWEQLWNGYEPRAIDAGLMELRQRLETGAEELSALAARAAAAEEEERAKIAAIDAALQPLFVRDTDGMWDDLLGPVVQLSGEATVGSGVLLVSQPLAADDEDRDSVEDGDAWRTYVLTSWHVVRDIYGQADKAGTPVPVKIYRPDGGSETEQAHLCAYDTTIDVALLVVHTPQALPNGAMLAPPSRLAAVKPFDRVYAVGCPLGNDPIPTAGEVASIHHEVDGEPYWMISAPTYIGNSGGGIFDADTRELLGIFSKIYTHGSMRSSIVPHMGLATPLPKIYAWLDSAGYGHLKPEDRPYARAHMAAAVPASGQ